MGGAAKVRKMLNYAEARARLETLLREKSVFEGDFVLSSGAKSTYYLDCRLTTLDAEGAHLVGQVVHTLIEEETSKRRVQVGAVGGLTMGADPIALAASMHSFRAKPHGPFRCFVVRKTAKAHGQAKLIEGNFREGDTVVVIDDVITTGESTLKAAEAVTKAGGKIAFVVVLVDRQEGGRENIERAGYDVISAFKRDDLLKSP